VAVDIEAVKKLKDLTGVGLTDAKAALEKSKGDFDKALSAMRQQGLTKAEKRGQREARAGLIGSYNHDGRIGVLVEVNCETDFVARNDIFKELVKDLAMQIAAANPQYVSFEDVPEAERDRVVAELTEQAKAENKPDDMIGKIVDGQVKKYFSERCLLDQSFVKEPEKTVSEFVKERAARLGENIVVRRFSRLALGEIN